MSKTADLRELITTQLNSVDGGTYHRRAPNDAAFPYKTYALTRVDLGDLSRDDFMLEVDVWDHSDDAKTVEAIADEVEAMFNDANLPQSTILPTFFRESRIPVDDPDKDIQHIRLAFLVELYERSINNVNS